MNCSDLIPQKKILTSAGIEPESPRLAVRSADHLAIRLYIFQIFLNILL